MSLSLLLWRLILSSFSLSPLFSLSLLFPISFLSSFTLLSSALMLSSSLLLGSKKKSCPVPSQTGEVLGVGPCLLLFLGATTIQVASSSSPRQLRCPFYSSLGSVLALSWLFVRSPLGGLTPAHLLVQWSVSPQCRHCVHLTGTVTRRNVLSSLYISST